MPTTSTVFRSKSSPRGSLTRPPKTRCSLLMRVPRTKFARFANRHSTLLARGVERRLAGRLGRVGDALEQGADRLLAFLAAEAELVEPPRARVLRRLECGAGGVLHPARRGAHQPRLGFRAGQQRGNQRARGKPAGERDQRRLAQRAGDALARILIGLDRAL